MYMYNPYGLSYKEIVALYSSYGLTCRKLCSKDVLRIYQNKRKNVFHFFDYYYKTGMIYLIAENKKQFVLSKKKDIEDAAILISKIKKLK